MARRERFSIGKLDIPNATSAAGGSRVSATLTPVSVAATSTVNQNVTVPGVQPGDIIMLVQHPIITAVVCTQCTCATAGTVAMTFYNSTGAGVVPTTGTYVFLVIGTGVGQ